MTETAPSVSTVFNDLHRTLFCFMMFAQMVRLAVKAIGRPSGMNAIATLTQSMINVGTLIQSGCFFRSQEALESSEILSCLRSFTVMSAYQTIMTSTIIVSIMDTMTMTKFRTSRSNVVIPFFGSFVSFAMRPKTVLSPVSTTTPMPLPLTQ